MADNLDGEEVAKPDPITLKPDLYEAAKSNDTDRVVNLLGDGVPPTHIELSSGWTALHWAAIHGNIIILKNLLAKGASEPYHRMMVEKFGPDVVGSEEKMKDDFDMKMPDDDDENEGERKRETAVDLTKNTPLLWAAYKGHLRAVWLLIENHYSPNDLDNMGNNALHLAAVNGHTKVLQVLIDDGGSANVVNFYKNRPIDMATKTEIRDILKDAMTKGASFTLHDIRVHHQENLTKYHSFVDNLNKAVMQAKLVENTKALMSSLSIPDAIRSLSDALSDAAAWGLDDALIQHGTALMHKLEATQDILADAMKLQQKSPLRSQVDYLEYVHQLERSLERAELVGLEAGQLQFGRELISRCNVEFWVMSMTNRLQDVVCARDEHEHDMTRLKQAIQKAQALRASDEVVDMASSLFNRLDVELNLVRALASIPDVRLPVENPPEDYWQESDKGKIKETEEYPLPPADTGVYIWEPAESFTALVQAVDKVKTVLAASEGSSVNQDLLAQVKETLFVSEKEVKLLDMKDSADRQEAIDAATKLAKKLKKGKKGKKKA